jgi:hypothetical protein
MLETYEAWRGTIMGDGQKEQLTTNLQLAANRHRQYCQDFMPEGVLRDTGIRTAEYTIQFWNALVAYIEDEYTLLLSFKLLPKHVLLLLSNQVVQICDDTFELRNCANNVDLQNPLATTTRYTWVTLQALGMMDSYLREKFWCHQPQIIRCGAGKETEGPRVIWIEEGHTGHVQPAREQVRERHQGQ